MPDIVIDWIGGNCPVQAEGAINGKPFYFRARGEHWSIGIDGDVAGDPKWDYREPYGDKPYAAGWMSEEEARAFIDKAAELYLNQSEPEDDGQPDEQQEWHDYDPHC